jgi:FkbM family methyltransferase
MGSKVFTPAKQLVKSVFSTVGLDIRKKRPTGMPEGTQDRGFHGKNSFADQLKLIGSHASVIFDIGANTGQTAARYRTLFPEATIYCFEPFPDSYSQVVRTFEQDHHVKPYQLAISDTKGHASFHTYTDSVTNSLLPAATESAQFVAAGQMGNPGVVTVESITVDEFCRREKITSLDIMKMDIQGGEVKALHGASELLKAQRISLIYAEVLFVPLYQGQAWFYDIAACLQAYGYRLFDFYDFHYGEDGQLKWGDAIFLPRN